MNAASDKKRRIRLFLRNLKPLLYLFPFLTGVAVFSLYPIVNVVIMSFKENYKYLTGKFSGYGFANYAYVLRSRDFQNAIQVTFKYVLIAIPVSMCLSIVIANLLNKKIKCRALFQTAYFLPMVTSVTAVGLTWKYMFNYKFGVINWLLNLFGIQSVNWLQNPASNFWALAIYGIWSMMPFTIILLLAGLQNIDPMFYTAARVDGAKGLRIFFRITLPLLSPTIFLVLIINSISAFKVFNELFPLFSGPGVGKNLYTMVYYIYEQFRGRTPPKYGYAAAAAVILFLIIFVFTMIQQWIQKKWKY